MRKVRILLVLGIWVAILPYLGFPYSWKDILTTLSGLGLIWVSFLLYKESKIKEIKKEKIFDNFRENSDFIKNESQNEIKTITDTQESEKQIKLNQEEI